MHEFHLDETSSVRFGEVNRSAVRKRELIVVYQSGVPTAFPSLRQRNIISARVPLPPGELLRPRAGDDSHGAQRFVAAVCVCALAVVQPSTNVGGDADGGG